MSKTETPDKTDTKYIPLLLGLGAYIGATGLAVNGALPIAILVAVGGYLVMWDAGRVALTTTGSGLWGAALRLVGLIASVFRPSPPPPGANYVLIGHTPGFRRPVWYDLAGGNSLFAGISQLSGKTTTLNTLICETVIRCDPAAVKLVIIDFKRDLSVFALLPHLVGPIAYDYTQAAAALGWVRAELERRNKLFAQFEGRRVCRKLEHYHRLAYPDFLPIVNVYFDEIALVAEGGKLFQQVQDLAKMGNGRGIYLSMATQRPTVKVISREIRTQCAREMWGYLPLSSEYTNVAEIPAAYHLPGIMPGRFSYKCGGSWSFVQVTQYSELETERIVAEHNMPGVPSGWPTIDGSALPVGDSVQAWVRQHLKDAPGRFVGLGALHVGYKTWAARHGFPGLTMRRFTAGMRRAGLDTAAQGRDPGTGIKCKGVDGVELAASPPDGDPLVALDPSTSSVPGISLEALQ